MASVNKVIIVGNLGADPETRYLPSGEAVTNIRVATTDRWKDKQSGELKEATEWHRIAFFGRLERTSVTPGMLASVAAMFYDTDVRAVLSAVRVPTLVQHRRGDRLVNVRSGRYVAEHIDGARLVEVPGSDHMAFFQHPEVFLDEIEEFLTGSRAVATPERRLATVLFSDIVGSTARAVDAPHAA